MFEALGLKVDSQTAENTLKQNKTNKTTKKICCLKVPWSIFCQETCSEWSPRFFFSHRMPCATAVTFNLC